MTVKEKMIQKLSGASLIFISHMATWIENDATIAIILVPLGLYLIFTRKKIMLSRDDYFLEDYDYGEEW